MYLLKPTALLIATLAIAGCGGGGSDPPVVLNSAEVAGAKQSDAVQLRSGQATSVEGTVATTQYVLKMASWQVTDAYPSPAPALTLGNSDCAISVRDNWVDPVMADGRYGRSTWVCKVDVFAPTVAAATLYTLTLTGLDAMGNQKNLQRQVHVVP